ncbi:MAG: MBL fold metallo-hydrolase [bacterium]
MIIQWLGQSCFKFQTKNNDQEITVITDPYSDSDKRKMSKVQVDIVTISHDHQDHNNLDAIKNDDVFVINVPGEYETKGVFVFGIPDWHDDKEGKERGQNTLYKFNIEDMDVLHLGDLGRVLPDEQIERIGNVDVLLIPVGGTYTIDAKTAVKVMSQLEPKIVIPMHYKLPGQTDSKLASVDEFIKLSGLTAENMDKLKILKKDLPMEDTKLIVLNN